MDNLNVLYVALTRPKEKLFLYCHKPKKSGTTAYTSLLSDYLDTREDAYEVRPDVRAIGTNNPKQIAKEADSPISTIQLHTTIFPDWTDRIAIAEQSTASRPTDNEAIRRGNQVHEILSHIASIDDVDNAIDSYAAHKQLDDETVNALRRTLSAMMQQPDVARFFNPAHTAKNECDIAWQGNVIRPDRIVYTPEAVYVIDFKTGQPSADHTIQVLHYCDALLAMGNPTVRGYLLYIHPDHCQVLPCE